MNTPVGWMRALDAAFGNALRSEVVKKEAQKRKRGGVKVAQKLGGLKAENAKLKLENARLKRGMRKILQAGGANLNAIKAHITCIGSMYESFVDTELS